MVSTFGHPTRQSVFGEPSIKIAQVGPDALREVGIDDGRGAPLVLTQHRRQFAGQTDRQVGIARPDNLAHALLVGRIHERPQQTHSERFTAIDLDQLAGGAAHFVVVERDDFGAFVIGALVQAHHVAARDQRPVILVMGQEVMQLVLVHARDLLLDATHEQHVLVAARGQQAGLCAGAREQRVGPDRRTVA